MTKPTNFYRKALMILNFVWRHFFTLIVIGMAVSVFVQAPVNWKFAFLCLCVAIFIDWGKIRLKFSNANHNHYSFEEMYRDHRRRNEYYESLNPGRPGTPAYHLDTLGRRY